MSVFKEPQCLIYTDSSSKKLCLDERVGDQLTSVTKQLHVIAIAGLYRTGKSYLLTRIAGRYKGFPLGSSIQSKTKGIWALCIDHPVHKDQMLLLLDTEGLGDIEKGDRNNDNQILTLATLSSSTLIYNSLGAFDDTALNKLNFITEMAKNIKTYEDSQSINSDTDFDVYFPEFILALRDFSLDLEIDGREVSPNEYLEHCLKAKEGESEDVQRYNEPRLCIRKYFKKRKCFVFERPVSRRKLKTLDTLTDSDLDKDFVEDTKQFLDYIHNKTVPMALTNGTPVTGRMFCTLVRSYINAIRKGAVPCIQSALRSMAVIENESAVEEAMGIYLNAMFEHVKLPTQTEQELRDIHLRSKDVAFDHFLKRRVLDDDNKHTLKLGKLVHEEYKKFVSSNENESRKRCMDALASLHATISSKINANVYAVPGGYQLYRKDREELKEMYNKTEGLGVKKTEAYIQYEEHMKIESEAVLKLDQTITEKEKALHLERESKERAEEREATMQKLLEENKKEMDDMRSQHAKEIDKVREDNKKDLANERARHEDILQCRMEELSRKQEEKLRIADDEHKQEIENMKQNQKQREEDMENNLKKMNENLENIEAENEKKEEEIRNLLAPKYMERESMKLAEENERMVQRKISESKKEIADTIYQHNIQMEKMQGVHSKDLNVERARLGDILETKIQETVRLQSACLLQVQSERNRQLERLRESKRQQEEKMKESMNRMINQLQSIKDENLRKDQEIADLQAKRRDENSSCIIS